jgi:hypothetical protein
VHEPSKGRERIYVCVRGIEFVPVSLIFLLEFETILTELFVLVVQFIIIFLSKDLLSYDFIQHQVKSIHGAPVKQIKKDPSSM